MGGLKEKNRIKVLIISISIAWLLSAPLAGVCAAELPVDIKPILLSITSSIADRGMGGFQKEYPESLSLAAGAESAASPLAVSPVRLYFPLNNNDVKYYEGSIQGASYYATYTYYQTSFNSRTCYVEQDSLDGSQTYYGYSGSELQMYGANVGGLSLSFDTPLTILNDSILNNGGSLQSSTTLSLEGYTVTVDVTVTSNLIGSVTIPLGRADNCRSIDMAFSFSIPGESETLEMRDAWILAPNIGKLQIAVLNEYLEHLGWLTINGGTVGGIAVGDILNPAVADFSASLLYGHTPLRVSFADQSSGSISSWSWAFGDGSGSSERNPVHTYTKPGVYTVSLTVTGPSGSDVETKNAYIEAIPRIPLPWLPLVLDD